MLNQILYKEDMEENCTCITVFKVLLLQNTSCCYFKFQSQVLLYSMEIIYLDLQLTPVVIFRCFCQGCIENRKTVSHPRLISPCTLFFIIIFIKGYLWRFLKNIYYFQCFLISNCIFHQTIFPSHVLTTFIIQNIYKRWVKQ